MTAELHSRRIALAFGAAATAGAATALTACGSTGNPQPEPADEQAPQAPQAAQPIAALDDLQVGEAKAVTANGEDVIVARVTGTTVAAFSAVCTHQGCKVQPEGAELRCPCHGSVFDAATGEVREGPAESPLPKVEVRVENGQIVSG